MAETDVSNEIVGETPDVVRDQAVRRLRKKRDFHAHLFIYTVVNAAAWVAWAFTLHGYPWPIWLTVGWGIGVLANLHVCAGVGGGPYLEYPYDPPGWTPERRDFMLAEPVGIDADGMVRVPDAPGLGVVLD